jgi:sorting nexin-29
VLEPSPVKVEVAFERLKSYKSLGTDQILAKLIKAGGETLYSEIHRLICCIWNKEELSQQWKKSIIVPVYKKGDKIDCNNYQGVSLLSTAYKILSNILLARLTPYVNEIFGDHQCGFCHIRSTMDQIFYVWWILEKNGSITGWYISYL